MTDMAIAVENLVPYSLSQPTIFKAQQLKPVIDLKLLVRDYEVRGSRSWAWLADVRSKSPKMR
jgi:hypothetical protein